MVLPAALLCLTVQASSPAVSLRIEVRDAWSGEPVAGALVELADVPRRAFTAADGRVTFGTLAPGPYHVAVRRIGYHPRALHALLGSSGLDLAVVMTAHPVFLAGRRGPRDVPGSGNLARHRPGAELGSPPPPSVVGRSAP